MSAMMYSAILVANIILTLVCIMISLKEGNRGATLFHCGLLIGMLDIVIKSLSEESRSIRAGWVIKPLQHIPAEAFAYTAWLAITLLIIGTALCLYKWVERQREKRLNKEKEDQGDTRPAGERETKTDQ